MVKVKETTLKAQIRASTEIKYPILIYWSDVDQVYVVEVPDLPGCMTHGDTYEKAVEMAVDAMQGWLACAEEDGDSLPTPTSRKLLKLKA